MKDTRHEGKWVRVPGLVSGTIGQYYWPNCKLELDVWYNESRANESCTGWYWQITDNGNYGRSAAAGAKYAPSYDPDDQALDEVKIEGLARFDSFPCLRPH